MQDQVEASWRGWATRKVIGRCVLVLLVVSLYFVMDLRQLNKSLLLDNGMEGGRVWYGVKTLDSGPAPSVVIGGIGDAGTTATTKALAALGMGHCPVRDIYAEPPWGHEFREERICALNQGQMTRGDFTRQSTSKIFRDTVNFFRTVALWDWNCINSSRSGRANSSLVWGFKEPHYAWLLPVMDHAFNNRSRYLIIARDPRDMCTNKIQDQFLKYGIGCLHISNSCFRFWAEFWHRLLAAYEFEPRFAVLRIEDLVMPDPATTDRSVQTLGCLLDYVGVHPKNATKMRQQLARFHAHNSSYMGHHNNITAETRRSLEIGVSHMTEVHGTMRRLGYHPERFELLQPSSRAVLCRGGG